MKWEILILTQPKRAPWLAECLLRLLPQITWPDVMVTIQTHDANLSLGANRQALLERATGDYVNFVDDDDLVSEDYAAEIYPHLGAVDCVTFPMQILLRDGYARVNETFAPLTLEEIERDWGWCRDILHISPLRREIATSFPMEGGREEDIRWARKIRKAGLLRTQHVVDHPLYIYHPGASRQLAAPRPAPPGVKLFWWQNDSEEMVHPDPHATEQG